MLEEPKWRDTPARMPSRIPKLTSLAANRVNLGPEDWSEVGGQGGHR